MGVVVWKVLLVSGAILGTASLYKVYEYVSRDKSVNKKAISPSVDKLKRVNIFSNGFINSPHLASLISYQRQNDQAVLKIDEEKLESTVKPFIREHLQKIFNSKGWNFDDLEGRIYYSIVGKTIEIYVLWKNHKFSNEYTNYDRLSLNF